MGAGVGGDLGTRQLPHATDARVGRSFWDTYVFGEPPTWRLHLEQVRQLALDGWFIYGQLGKSTGDRWRFRREILEWARGALVVRDYCVATPPRACSGATGGGFIVATGEERGPETPD
jgi:hypothetical protein